MQNREQFSVQSVGAPQKNYKRCSLSAYQGNAIQMELTGVSWWADRGTRFYAGLDHIKYTVHPVGVIPVL